MTFYAQLQRQTAGDRQFLLTAPVIQRAVAGTLPLASYIAFLTEAYHHVKHTVPLLMALGSRIPESKEWLRTAVAEYIAEELGHQEWVLNDIEACGGNKASVRSGSPRLATEVMVSYAWDTVQRNNPVGFFGMVHVLEGTSVSVATRAAKRIQSSLGLPDEAFSYLSSHGELDRDHVRFFADLVNRIDSEADRTAIVHVAQVIYRLYGAMFRSLPLHADGTRVDPLVESACTAELPSTQDPYQYHQECAHGFEQ